MDDRGLRRGYITDAYSGRDSRRSNAPAGNFRRELVRATKANELKLSGSPIQYFTDADYQNAEHEVTGTYKMGIAGLYDHTDTAWLDPDAVVSSVSTDGYTITLSAGVSVGDLIEVYYYATGTGWRDAETPSQVGDPRTPETMDALVQKMNDCPPLDWENNSPAMVYDISMCRSAVVPVNNDTTTVVKYTAAQVGTWQTSNTPFYVTAIHMGFDGASIVMDPTSGTTVWAILYTVDGGTERTIAPNQIQHLTSPANPGVAGYYQSFFINLGLVECRDEFILKITTAAVPATAWETNVAGWHS